MEDADGVLHAPVDDNFNPYALLEKLKEPGRPWTIDPLWIKHIPWSEQMSHSHYEGTIGINMETMKKKSDYDTLQSAALVVFPGEHQIKDMFHITLD